MLCVAKHTYRLGTQRHEAGIKSRKVQDTHHHHGLPIRRLQDRQQRADLFPQ